MLPLPMNPIVVTAEASRRAAGAFRTLTAAISGRSQAPDVSGHVALLLVERAVGVVPARPAFARRLRLPRCRPRLLACPHGPLRGRSEGWCEEALMLTETTVERHFLTGRLTELSPQAPRA